MATKLPQKYHDVVRDLIPYQAEQPHQMGLISFEPALPCVLCGRPATTAIVAQAPEPTSGAAHPWLTFPICPSCEERQVKTPMAERTQSGAE